MPNVAHFHKTNAESLVDKNEVVIGLLHRGSDAHEELEEYIKGRGTTLKAVLVAYKKYMSTPSVTPKAEKKSSVRRKPTSKKE